MGFSPPSNVAVAAVDKYFAKKKKAPGQETHQQHRVKNLFDTTNVMVCYDCSQVFYFPCGYFTSCTCPFSLLVDFTRHVVGWTFSCFPLSFFVWVQLTWHQTVFIKKLTRRTSGMQLGSILCFARAQLEHLPHHMLGFRTSSVSSDVIQEITVTVLSPILNEQNNFMAIQAANSSPPNHSQGSVSACNHPKPLTLGPDCCLDPTTWIQKASKYKFSTNAARYRGAAQTPTLSSGDNTQ